MLVAWRGAQGGEKVREMTSRRGRAAELEVKVLCYTAGERAIERHWRWVLEE